MSQEDREFLRKAEEGIHHREDLQYEMPLPFREENIQLPDNCPQAVQRLAGLKKRLQANDKYHADYVNFMADTIDKGHARKVDSGKLVTQKGKVWYLPHHGIYHLKKQVASVWCLTVQHAIRDNHSMTTFYRVLT